MSCDNEPHSNHVDEGVECSEPGNWSSDASNSDDEDYIISVRLFKITHFSALFLSSVSFGIYLNTSRALLQH